MQKQVSHRYRSRNSLAYEVVISHMYEVYYTAKVTAITFANDLFLQHLKEARLLIAHSGDAT